MSERIKIYKYFTRRDFGTENIAFDSILSEAIENALEIKGLERDSFLTANVAKYWRFVTKTQNDNYTHRKIQPLFTTVNSSSRIIRCFLDDRFATNKEDKYLLLKARSYILKEIDILNSRMYEALAIKLCRLLNAENTLLTPSGNEAGIDFLATIKHSDEANYFFGVNGPIRIIGQSKKYSTALQVDKVKEFNSTINDVYSLTPKILSILPSWFSESKGIIIGWIISHSGFQQGAKDRAKNYGILLSDSIDMAELISSSTNFYTTLDYNERHKHLASDLNRIIAEFT